MTPVQILQDVIIIARAIKAQVDLAKNNKEKLRTLSRTIECVIVSLEGLETLPDNKHFVKSLTDFQTCIHDAQKCVIKITQMGKMTRFFYAQSNESDLNTCKAAIIDFIPLLNLGLNAQHLMDKEQDRRDALADRQAFIAQKEQALREAQSKAKLEQRERDAIILKQLASVSRRIDRQSLPLAVAALPEELIVNLDDIVFEEKLVEGDFGSIYQGTWQDQPVTIKCFDHIATESERRHLVREAQVMSRLHHDTITHFYGACLDADRPCVLTSVLAAGSLETVLASLALDKRLAIVKDLACGLAYLHSQPVIHGDIHPKNIGINQHHEAKWTDFGLAKVRSAGIATLPRVSYEAAWQAPESWQNRAELSTASDVYSFGMLLWTLVTGKLPYADITAPNIIRLVERGEREVIPNNVPRDCRELIEACWSADPTQRPTAKQITQRLSMLDLHAFRAPSPTGEEYYERGVTSHKAGNLPEAYADYQRGVQKDYFKAYTRVGFFALQGLGGVSVDKAKAQSHFEIAAARGHADAMFNLGRLFEKGDTATGDIDLEKALFWYERTLKADPEFPRCQEKIASISAQLHSLKQNAVTARVRK
jgi:tetratricopeptide (TPR) repeat protein